jgi:translocation and assembly module TamB
MALTLEPQALPLWVAGLITDPLPVTGLLTGKVTMHGLAHDRLASFDVRLADIAAESARAAPRNLVLIANGTTDRNAVTFQADLAGARGATLHASGRVPFDGKGALAVDANGDADLSFANAWLSATGERATGRLSLSAKVTGTLQSPRVAGSGTIHDGFFRSPDAGLELRNIEAQLEGSERRIVLSSLSAKAPNGGSVSASGDVTLDHAAGYPVSLTVTARKAQLVATSLTTLTTAIDAKLTGALLRKPLVSGTIDIARWDIRVPERLARPLTPIPVTHTNVAPGFVTAAEAEDATPDSAFTFALDLTVRAPREVFVRGQGIDAEFGGDAKLTGTVDDPAVRGRFDLRRGSITLLSQRVSLSRGSVQFLGDLEPVLDIAGGVTKNSVTATVTVKGKASDPQIALSSVPSMPQDEILARLLFSKQTSQLSPFEAAELAQAVGKWSGLTSGPDILDRLRNAIGIDALSATTDEKGATAVNAGRYIGSGVFVGVSQASGGSATVDVDLSEDIKLRGEAGAKGTKVGVAAEWEY